MAAARLEHVGEGVVARLLVDQAVGEIDKAFRKQAEALDEYRFIDLESEMDVMRDMLKADGSVKKTSVSTGALTEDERQIIADGCLINYYRNN